MRDCSIATELKAAVPSSAGEREKARGGGERGRGRKSEQREGEGERENAGLFGKQTHDLHSTHVSRVSALLQGL